MIEDTKDDGLPADLRGIETQLLSRGRTGQTALPSSLRARVLRSIRAERRREESRSWLVFVAATAAVAVFWVQLVSSASLAGALQGSATESSRPAARVVAEISAEIREALPDLPSEETKRLALSLRSAARIRFTAPPAGAVRPAATQRLRSLSDSEAHLWDTLFSGS